MATARRRDERSRRTDSCSAGSPRATRAEFTRQSIDRHGAARAPCGIAPAAAAAAETMTRPQIDVEIRTGMCTALLQSDFRNLELMDAAIAQTPRLAGPNSYILACNSSLSSLKNRKRRLSILLAQLSGKKRARVRTPGDVRRVGEPMERLAHVRQPLGLGGELDERCAERLSAGRLVEVRRQSADGPPVEIEATARVAAGGEEEQGTPHGAAPVVLVQGNVGACDRREDDDRDREAVVDVLDEGELEGGEPRLRHGGASLARSHSDGRATSGRPRSPGRVRRRCRSESCCSSPRRRLRARARARRLRQEGPVSAACESPPFPQIAFSWRASAARRKRVLASLSSPRARAS